MAGRHHTSTISLSAGEVVSMGPSLPSPALALGRQWVALTPLIEIGELGLESNSSPSDIYCARPVD